MQGYIRFRVSQNVGYHFGDPHNLILVDCGLHWGPLLVKTTIQDCKGGHIYIYI